MGDAVKRAKSFMDDLWGGDKAAEEAVSAFATGATTGGRGGRNVPKTCGACKKRGRSGVGVLTPPPHPIPPTYSTASYSLEIHH